MDKNTTFKIEVVIKEKPDTDIMVYMLNKHQGFTEFAHAYAKDEDLKLQLTTTQSSRSWMEECYKACSMEEWLGGFDSAKMVFTDSFHDTVFSIIFNKPFVVFENPRRGNSRMQTLLAEFGLSERLVKSISDIEEALSNEIDWTSINQKITSLRKSATIFLTESLK